MLSDEEKQRIRLQATSYEFFWKYGDELLGIYPPEVACVYACKMANDTVKIGISQDVFQRKIAIQGASGIEVLDFYYTGFAPRKFMLGIEKRCHETFKDYRTNGEYFNITFEDACAELDKYSDEIADALKSADLKFLEEVDYYNELEKAYFNSLTATPKIKPQITAPKIRKKKIKDSLTFEQLQFLIEHCTNEKLRDDLIRKAAGNLEPPRCVYILELSNGTVKIGMTQDFQRRAREILNSTGLTVKNWCHTSYLPTEIAREIEAACIEHFAEFQTEGEFFTIEFETATSELSKRVEIVEFMQIL